MALSYERFNLGDNQLTYDATIADDLRRLVENYNKTSGMDYVYIEQSTDYFSIYRMSEWGEPVILFATNDHNWFAEFVKNHCS